MKKMVLHFGLILAANGAVADTVVAKHAIRSRALIDFEDVMLLDADTPGALTDLSDVVGQEARVILYPGRPIRSTDIGPAATVERNGIVTLIYSNGPLTIVAEGRALNRGGIGDQIRVLNVSSRNTVTGTIEPSGQIRVTP